MEMSNNALKDKIFEFAYKMAFLDATMRNAFQKWEDESDDSFHERKRHIRDKSMPLVRKYIDTIFKGEVESPDDVYHVIISICDKEAGFTFGNAQKLVNMTAKYMFLSTFDDEEKKKLFLNCHCPMDGVMIRNIKKELPGIEWDTELSWSKLDLIDKNVPKEYRQFQGYIDDLAEKTMKIGIARDVMPIEVDYLYWDD